jgi:hypothetical protein
MDLTMAEVEEAGKMMLKEYGIFGGGIQIIRYNAALE